MTKINVFFNKIMNLFKEIFKDKKKLLIFVIGVVVFFLLIFICFFNKNGFMGILKNPDGERFKSEYEKLNGVVTKDGKEYPEVNISVNNNFKYTDIDGVLDIFNNRGDAVIYFGYPSCLYCRTAIQILYDTAKNTDLNNIYYLDVEDKNNKYDDLMNILDKEFIDNETRSKKIYSPLVLFITDGKVVSYNKGTLFSQEDPYMPLDEFQRKGLSWIYEHGINDVLESIKVKNGSLNSNNDNI